MALPLMPKATAVWLVENTSLTFDQIAAFCGLHPLEVQAIADGEVAIGMQGLDPVTTGQLTAAEIERCSHDPKARLQISKPTVPAPRAKPKGARYTPVSKRQDRPDAIAWLIKHYPELGDSQIARLIGTTKPTIAWVRSKSHWNAPNIKPQNPISLGLCSEEDLEKAVRLARGRQRAAEARGRAVLGQAAKLAIVGAPAAAGGPAAEEDADDEADGTASGGESERPTDSADAPAPGGDPGSH